MKRQKIQEYIDGNLLSKTGKHEEVSKEETMISNLFEPASIKGIIPKNRFVRSATIEGLTIIDGCPNGDLS